MTRYAQRMLIENGISEAIQFFHLDALSSMVGLKVDFDLQITLMASTLYRLMADRIGREYGKAAGQDDLPQPAGCLRDGPDRGGGGDRDAWTSGPIIPYLVASGLADQPTPMPWFGNKLLKIRFA